MAKKITILGATGSIGRSTLDVVREHPGRFEIDALAAHSNVDLLIDQYREFHPARLCLIDQKAAENLAKKLSGESVQILAGEEAMVELTSREGVDLILNAVVGAAGLRASIKTISAGKDLALANKESLVSGGPLFPKLLKETDARILPVDSEHCAIWQAVYSGKAKEIRRVLLTASGGPFRTWPKEKLAEVSPKEALNHPTWKMGAKITIDSATLVNKGLEVIEAAVLFSLKPQTIEVVVHPQSIIHSMVEFVDSSVIAQMSNPDMRLPISYALFWPDRVKSDFGRMDFSSLPQLTFEPPDYDRFPALRLAFEVADAGGIAPAVYSAANEVAVAAFLEGKIRFTEIAETLYKTLADIKNINEPNLEDILKADQSAREIAIEQTERSKC